MPAKKAAGKSAAKARKPVAKKAAAPKAAARKAAAAKPLAAKPLAAKPPAAKAPAAKGKAPAAKPAPKAKPAAPAKSVPSKAESAKPASKSVTPSAAPAKPAKPAAAPPGPATGQPRAESARATAVKGAGPATPLVQTSMRQVAQVRGAAPADGDDEGYESASSLSLLAGPRNVKPYLAKKGEQYMSKDQLEHFRQILQNWKRDLMEEVDRTVTHMKDEAANPPDPNDRATLESEFSLELRTRDRERKLIRKIDEALKRIEDGSYGYCLETGEEIGIKRLEARPVATLSIEAQERRERREKQYGDRDDRYR
jgi:DnaK suppressor protein